MGDHRAWQALKQAAINVGVTEERESGFHKKFTPHPYRTVFTALMRNQRMSDHILKYIRRDANQETMDIYTRVDRSQG